MNTDDLAAIFEGLAAGLRSGLKKSSEEGLRQLADMFRRFPNQSVQDYIKFVESCLVKERTSVPVMLQRIKSVQTGNRVGIEELQNDINKLKANELKKLVIAIGQKPARTAGENKALLLDVLGGVSALSWTEIEGTNRNTAIEGLRREFIDLRDNVERLSLDEIKQRFESIRARDKAGLGQLLTSLGYSQSGSKEDMEEFLLSILERRKVSSEQTGHI